jgi:hypothetical protein
MLIKVFFYLIISYLRIKSYNVLNYNNCSTDWSFPLTPLLTIFQLNRGCQFNWWRKPATSR